MKLKKYTGLLRYPEYATNEWPDDTYVIVVSAHSYDAATDVARNTAFHRINKGLTVDELVVCQPEDLEVVCVVEGDHEFYRCL
jgi:hypothetical protein